MLAGNFSVVRLLRAALYRLWMRSCNPMAPDYPRYILRANRIERGGR